MDSIAMSLPLEKTVRGYTIQRMALGAYLKALKQIQAFPRELVARLLPEGDLGRLLEQLKHIDRDGVIDLMLKSLSLVPEQTLELIAGLTGIPQEKLLTDPGIGADGLAEIIDVWLEVNGAENFSRAASHAGKTIKALAATLRAGSKG